jgi:hypothetical protein
VRAAIFYFLFAGLVFGAPCGPKGDNKEARIQALDQFKNRTSVAEPDAIDLKITLESILAPGDDENRFKNEQAVTVTGYVALVKDGGAESCNCHSKTAKDTHIVIVASKKDATNPKHHVIVEVTPHFRELGTTADLKKKLVGHMVKFSGWLFFDEEHKQNASNTNPKGTDLWRATCWEIHPVTGIEIVDQSAFLRPPFPPKAYPPDRWLDELNQGKIDSDGYGSLIAGRRDLTQSPFDSRR